MHSLLVLSPAFPYPPQSGGDIRTFELLRRLSDFFDLSLLSYGSGDVNEFMRRSGVKSVLLITGSQPAPSGGRFRKKLDLWTGAPHGLRLSIDPVFARALAEQLTRVQPQAVVIEHVYMTQYRKFIGVTPMFVSCHNVETIKMKRWFTDEKVGMMARLRQRLQVHFMRRHESKLSRWAHTVFTTSEVDQRTLQQMNGHGRFVSVPNGADLKAFKPRSEETFQGHAAAFFVGSLFYQPNLDAAMILKTEIWPKVRRAIPDAICHLAGKPGGTNVSALHDPANGVHFHSLVPDIRPYLTMSQVMIVPLRVGGGVRIKILEAMASGTPVVSTRIGSEGIHCTNGKNILLADSVEKLSECVVELLRDRKMAFQIGKAGRLLAETHYSWDRSAEIMRKAIQAAMPSLDKCLPAKKTHNF